VDYYHFSVTTLLNRPMNLTLTLPVSIKKSTDQIIKILLFQDRTTKRAWNMKQQELSK